MRRSASSSREVVHLGRLSLISDQTLVYGSRSVHLTPMEFRLLRYLARCPGQPVSNADLVEHVWRYPRETAGSEVVRAHVRNIRAKLERSGISPELIATHPRIGYSLQPSAGDRRRPSRR